MLAALLAIADSSRPKANQVKELVTQAQGEMVLRIIAILTPIAGVVVGALIGLVRKRVLRGAAVGLAVGLLGTAVYGLWRMHISFGEHFGYTSVASLAVQLVIFATLGAIAGTVVQRIVSRNQKLKADG